MSVQERRSMEFASSAESYPLFLYAINSPEELEKLKLHIYPIIAKSDLFENDPKETDMFYEDLMCCIVELKKGYETETQEHSIITPDDEEALARELSKYLTKEFIADTIDEPVGVETAETIPTNPVFVSDHNFKKEITFLRRYLGALRILKHPTIPGAVTIFNKKIGRLNKWTFFIVLGQLQRAHPDYRMTNMWKNDAVYTGADDKTPNWIGCEYTLELDKVTKKIDMNTITLSMLLTIEK